MQWHLSDKALDEFVTIYEDEFQEKITREEARVIAADLLTLYQVLMKKLPGEEAEQPTQPSGDVGTDQPMMGFRTT